MRKLTRTAASRVYPMARPKVMVPPERETPGINASIWPMPKISASFQVISFMVLTCLERASTTHSSTPNNASTVTVIHRLRSDPSIACLNSRPAIRIGIVPRMMNQHLRVWIVRSHTAFEILAFFAEQGAEPCSKNADDVMSEIQNHGKLGADLDDCGERGARIGSQHQIADNANMRAGRNWQVLGQCLHQTKENRLEEIHEPSFICINGFVCFSASKTSERGLIFRYGSLSCLKPCTQWCQNPSELH